MAIETSILQFLGLVINGFHRWVNSHGRTIKERRHHDKCSVTVLAAKLIHSGKDYMLNGFTTADKASIYKVLRERWMDVGMVDSVVLARHNKMLSILFIQPRSAMLETADRLAAGYDKELEKAEALLQNIQTYGVWAVMVYHLFRLPDQQVQDEAELTTEQMFGWEQQGGQQPQMADAGGSDHALAERLAKALDGLMKHLAKMGVVAAGTSIQVFKVVDEAAQIMRAQLLKETTQTTREGVLNGYMLECFLNPHASFFIGLMRTEPLNGKTVITNLRVIHDSMDVFIHTGLAQVLEYLRQERIHADGPATKGAPAV
ncbi:hypothetical protein SARC_13958 [Sphaeroforma arctica JP610]|uniref:Uncharacterized protein n=1 Tax=Sphaeroforma arctica JP610 TaxID=667725 RepID=A0A0L0F9S5_9EUKA|nr:hypothetical protein SARC_13958 [Sphaeroforma arctica JP610]KNC73482.1 hypothetical protein SARC_13958 [Sphaeroforma arctica JP610]|eukprot:XP_014147384.1 hypothetical protein SARC_13958 [Sphaeroforma arctica JP610]